MLLNRSDFHSVVRLAPLVSLDLIIRNARGEVILHARIADGLQPGVLVSESIWPSEAFEGGIGINALTSDDPGPPGGGAVFHDTAVWLR